MTPIDLINLNLMINEFALNLIAGSYDSSLETLVDPEVIYSLQTTGFSCQQ
jgi:hypothetical protein